MPQERNALKVGIVTVAVVATFFALLIWISQRVGGDLCRVQIRFPSSPEMPTLGPGSPVLVGGDRVGQVVSSGLRPLPRGAGEEPSSGDMAVFVEVDLRGDLLLRPDYRIIAEGPPLGGDGVVKIHLGRRGEARPLREYAGQTLQGAEPAGFAAILAALQGEFDDANPTGLLTQIKAQLSPDGRDSLMAKLLQSLSDINHMTAALARELSPDQKAALLAKIHEVVDHLSGTTAALRHELEAEQPATLLAKVHVAFDALNEDLATLTRLVKTNEPAITRTIGHVEATARNIASETDPENLDGLLAHMKEAGRRLNASMADINQVTDTTRQVVVLNRENLNRLLANFKEASDHIKSGAQHVLRHPWRLFKEPSLPELREEVLLDAARSFADAAARVDDASARLQALSEIYGGSIPLDDPDLAQILADLKQTQAQYQAAEAEFWRKMGLK